jgi:hypothetical protein
MRRQEKAGMGKEGAGDRYEWAGGSKQALGRRKH